MPLMSFAEEPRKTGTWLGLVVSLVAAIVASHTLLAPGFYDSHDGLLNVHRLVELEKCLADGPTPCRWAPDMGYGYGTPLFVFYPPFSTYVSAGFRALGSTHLDAVKLAMVASFVVGALTMFALARRFFGQLAAAVAAVLYTFAPYRAVDVFARGALAEAWGIALVPMVFLTAERAMCAERRKWFWGLACALAWACLLLTHNLTTLMIAPAYVAWSLLWLLSGARSRVARTWRSLAPFAAGHVVAFLLAAYYVVPSLLEQSHAHTGTLSTLYAWARYENNFISFSELLLSTTPWGYGAFRQPGGISLSIGLLHWGLALAALVGIGIAAARRDRLDGASRAALLLGAAGGAAALMTVAPSRIVWDAVPVLAWLQFPWRFLTVSIFGFSFAAAWLVARTISRPSISLALSAVIITAAVGTAYTRFAPSMMHQVQNDALANELAVARARHGLFDFLPIGVELAAIPRRAPRHLPPPVESLDPLLEIKNARRTSHGVAFDTESSASAPVTARINTFRFPGWTLRIDGASTTEARHPDPLGRIHVAVPPGRHRVSARFERTSVRAVADGLSVVGGLVALSWMGVALRSARYAGS